MTVLAVAQEERAVRTSHKLRALRHLASEFGVGPIACTAWHPRFQVLSGQVENLSMGGLCVRFPGALLLGTPITVASLGEVVPAPMLRQGAVTRNGRGEITG